jgi:hypothetical protein
MPGAPGCLPREPHWTPCAGLCQNEPALVGPVIPWVYGVRSRGPGCATDWRYNLQSATSSIEEYASWLENRVS